MKETRRLVLGNRYTTNANQLYSFRKILSAEADVWARGLCIAS